ncbi:TPA: hypothetical protein JLQ64_003949 [Escherichia coli]|nr:hypothetical protein [Escherichia coli]
MTNELFTDVNFLGLDAKERGVEHEILSLKELSHRYSFITFNKPDNGMNTYIIHNLLEELQNTLGIEFALNKLKSSLYKVSRKRKFHSYISKYMDRNLRKQIKQQLRIKRSCYDKLYTHYCHIKKDHKKETIMMLPVLFGFDDARIYQPSFDLKFERTRPIQTWRIYKVVEELNKSFNKMLKKLSKRKAYSVFKACSHVVLLGERHIPYLQVIFYYVGKITDYFIRDMAREWCVVNKCGVWLDYVKFDDELPHDRDHNEELCQQGYYTEEQNQYQIKASIRNLILPFSDEYTDVLIPNEQDSRHERNANYILEKAMRGRIKIAPYFEDKKRKKFIRGIKNTTLYHLYYLEQVAKQFTKIPKVTGPTYKKFTYQKGYTPKKCNKS